MIGNIISYLASFIISGISILGYWGVGFMMAVESACIPLPSEIIMPFAGFLISEGRFALFGATMAGALGSVAGSVATYWVGSYGGRVILLRYGKYILISRHEIEMADKFFTKYGNGAIFFSRMMPVVRTFISLPAGIAKMNFNKFVFYTFFGSIPWCFALAYAGKKLGDNWDTLGIYFHKLDILILTFFVIGFTWFIRKHLNIKK